MARDGKSKQAIYSSRDIHGLDLAEARDADGRKAGKQTPRRRRMEEASDKFCNLSKHKLGRGALQFIKIRAQAPRF